MSDWQIKHLWVTLTSFTTRRVITFQIDLIAAIEEATDGGTLIHGASGAVHHVRESYKEITGHIFR